MRSANCGVHVVLFSAQRCPMKLFEHPAYRPSLAIENPRWFISARRVSPPDVSFIQLPFGHRLYDATSSSMVNGLVSTVDG